MRSSGGPRGVEPAFGPPPSSFCVIFGRIAVMIEMGDHRVTQMKETAYA